MTTSSSTHTNGTSTAKKPSRIASEPLDLAYAPAPETAKVKIHDRYDLFINNTWVAPRGSKSGSKSAGKSSDHYFPTLNPANEATLAQIAQAGDADVDAAVKAARAAFPKWAALAPIERAKYIFRLARRIQERSRELAVLESIDSGKPIKESRDVDVPLVAAHFFYHAGWADKLEYAFPGSTAAPKPLGVCAQIIPWNFPLLMAAWKLAPALCCGNTVVLKPAETTPLTALMLAELIEEISLPPGVVNIVTGDGRTGAALVNHPDVDKIAFTGSTEVGKRIALAAAKPRASGSFPSLTLELGGKSPHIIFEDASLDQAIEGIVQGIYFNQGEVCCAGSRLFVQEPILDEVTRKLSLRLASLRVGDPLDKNTDVGAINSKAQLTTIRKYLDLGPKEGATLVEPNRSTLPSKGYWCRPCFFTGVQPSHTVAREEIFGPVLSVLSFRTPEEAITRANNTPYGLAAGIWTDKGSKMFEIARQLKAGVIWCNTYNKFDPTSPFGGYKESGFGREGGVHGLRAYVKAE
ncbi:MAG: aldehyde dehydrogenase family protein [Phycisphaerales bacterium]|nr:MAG: aldehyde dehydrogenase family protein [Phycisphaerales bacterium]